jgi:hypothetical protein
MPIRIASLSHQIQKNGARLHLAMASRTFSKGVDQPASDHEQALLDERRLLKEARAKRQAQAKLPKPKATKLVKEAKPLKPLKPPKAPKAAKGPKEAKAAKNNKPSRADKLKRKAENLEADKKAARKSAKT